MLRHFHDAGCLPGGFTLSLYSVCIPLLRSTGLNSRSEKRGRKQLVTTADPGELGHSDRLGKAQSCPAGLARTDRQASTVLHNCLLSLSAQHWAVQTQVLYGLMQSVLPAIQPGITGSQASRHRPEERAWCKYIISPQPPWALATNSLPSNPVWPGSWALTSDHGQVPSVCRLSY